MSWKILYLNKKDVAGLGVSDMKAALKDVEAVMSLEDKKETLHPYKVAMEWNAAEENRINAMPGYLGGEYQMAGIKWIGSNPKNLEKGLPRASAITILNDPETKLPVCIMDGTSISAMRTGASGGVGVKYLAKEDSKTLVILGAGVQSRTQLEAAFLARPSIEEVYVFDLFLDRAEAFAKEMGEKLGLNVQAAKTLQEAKALTQRADILVSATVAAKPIVDADWLNPGITYVQIGGEECTYDVVRKADKRVCDEWVHVLHRQASAIAQMGVKGLITEKDIYADLGEIINGKKPGRENREEIIYYNAVGMGNEDIAVATRLYRKAKEDGVGQWLDYWD